MKNNYVKRTQKDYSISYLYKARLITKEKIFLTCEIMYPIFQLKIFAKNEFLK